MGLRRKKKTEEPEDLERWLISYSDFMTLLVAFFVVMYAISSVNEGKYQVLSQTLMSVFTHAPTSAQPIRFPNHARLKPLVHAVKVAPSIPRVIPLSAASQGDENLAPLLKSIRKAFASLIASGQAQVKRTPLGIEVQLNADLLFPSGSDMLTMQAIPILSRMGIILETLSYPVEVEGYTDSRPIHTPRFTSNWNLSVARAVTVVKLFQVLDVAPQRMVAAGFGKYHPVASNRTAAGRAKNRRVEILILAKDHLNGGNWPVVPSSGAAGIR